MLRPNEAYMPQQSNWVTICSDNGFSPVRRKLYIYQCWLIFHMILFQRNLNQALLWRHNGTMASLITSLTSVYSTVHSGADQRKHQSSASLAFVRGIHRGPVLKHVPHNCPMWAIYGAPIGRSLQILFKGYRDLIREYVQLIGPLEWW